jgi:HEAT repeat protein
MGGNLRLTAEEAKAFLDARKNGDVDALLDALRDPSLRPSAVRRLGELRAKEAIPRVIPLLQAPAAPLRRAAAHALGQLRAQEAVGELRAVAFGDHDPAARAWALFALGCIGIERTDERLLRLASDPNDMVRQAVIGSLIASHFSDVAAAGTRLRRARGWRERRAIDRVVQRIRKEAQAPVPD